LSCTLRVGVGQESAPTRPASSQRFSLNLWLPSPWITPSFGRTDHSLLRTDRDRFRINQLSSGFFRVPSNDSPCCCGAPHLAYLTAPGHLATCATSPCTRLSRVPWWDVTLTSTIGTP